MRRRIVSKSPIESAPSRRMRIALSSSMASSASSADLFGSSLIAAIVVLAAIAPPTFRQTKLSLRASREALLPIATRQQRRFGYPDAERGSLYATEESPDNSKATFF
jgi:hypothetical protein